MSALRVSEVGESGHAEWDAYARSRAQATVYHLSAWRRIFGDALGYPAWFLAARDDAGVVRGILPLYCVRGLRGRRLVAVPFRDRGGPVFDSPRALDLLLARARELARARDAALVVKCLAPLPAHDGFARQDRWIHSVLPLAGATRDSLWASIGAKNRNMVRQAQERGLQAACAPLDKEAAARWYTLHAGTQHRLGVPAFPRAFFERMLELLAPAGNVALLEVADARGPCAATLLLLHGDRCIYGYSASTFEGQRLRANDLMLFEAIALAAQRGLDWFDFGSDSPAQETLLFFKRKLGARQEPIPSYVSGGAGAPDSSDARYALARSVFRALPEGVATWLGSRLVARFG